MNEEKYTKYEIARILGARALQIAMNAPLLINIPKEKLEEINYDPLKIAEIEFNANVLPITVKRPFPQKEEIEEKEEIEIIEEEKEVPAEKIEKIEEKEEKVEEEKIEEKEEEEEEEEEEEIPIETSEE